MINPDIHSGNKLFIQFLALEYGLARQGKTSSIIVDGDSLLLNRKRIIRLLKASNEITHSCAFTDNYRKGTGISERQGDLFLIRNKKTD